VIPEEMNDAFVGAVVASVVVAPLAGLYLWRLWWTDPQRPRSPVLLSINICLTAIWVYLNYFAVVAVIRLTWGLDAIPEWTQWITASSPLAFCAVIAVPAVYFWRLRRRRDKS
jgi:hypothetical protein